MRTFGQTQTPLFLASALRRIFFVACVLPALSMLFAVPFALAEESQLKLGEKEEIKPMKKIYRKLSGMAKFHGGTRPSPKFRSENCVWTDEELRIIAENYKHFRPTGMAREYRDKLRRFNPDIKFTWYMGSTYIKVIDNPDKAERELRHCLAMTAAARLAEDIDAEATRFRLLPYTEEMMTKRGARINEEGDHAPAGIPIYASVAEGDYSSSYLDEEKPMSHNFVFWVRVGDECMRVNKWEPENGKIEVTRGFSNTKAVDHKTSSVLCSPMYCGSSGYDKKWKRAIPYGWQNYLSYILDKHENAQDGFRHKSELALKIMQEEDADGVNMDVMSANVPMFNMGDCFGRKAVPWNFAANREYTPYEWITGHERQINYMNEYIKGKTGKYPVLIPNGIGFRTFDEEYGGGKRLLIPTKIKPYPLYGYNSEKGFAATGKIWAPMMTVIQKCCQEDLGGRFQIKAGGSYDPEEYERGLQYGYANFLLAVEKGKDKTLLAVGVMQLDKVEDDWSDTRENLHPEEIPVEFEGHEGKWAKRVKLHPMLYWPIGDPVETAKPGDLEKYQIKDTTVYRRRFTNGIVMVNPMGGIYKEGDASVDIDLDAQTGKKEMERKETFEIKLDRNYIDPMTGIVVNKVTMPPISGKILLSSPELTGE